MVNQNIAEDGEATRFGKPGGADPSVATKQGEKKWSIRNAMRHIAAQEADPSDDSAIEKLITRNGKTPTVAENIAAAILSRAATGYIPAALCAMDSIEGKLPQSTQIGGIPGGEPIDITSAKAILLKGLIPDSATGNNPPQTSR